VASILSSETEEWSVGEAEVVRYAPARAIPIHNDRVNQRIEDLGKTSSSQAVAPSQDSIPTPMSDDASSMDDSEWPKSWREMGEVDAATIASMNAFEEALQPQRPRAAVIAHDRLLARKAPQIALNLQPRLKMHRAQVVTFDMVNSPAR